MTTPMIHATATAANVDRGASSPNSRALAHHWWDPDSAMFGPLHRINPLRLDWIERVAGGLAGKRVVDVGCGGGILSEAMAARGRRGRSASTSAKRRSASRGCTSSNPDATVDYRLVAAEALAAEMPAAFDVVTCMELLEHVPDPGVDRRRLRRAREARRHRRRSRRSTAIPKAYALAILGAEYVLRTAAARHARLREIPDAGRSRRVRAARRARDRRHHRHDLQPVHARRSGWAPIPTSTT